MDLEQRNNNNNNYDDHRDSKRAENYFLKLQPRLVTQAVNMKGEVEKTQL